MDYFNLCFTASNQNCELSEEYTNIRHYYADTSEDGTDVGIVHVSFQTSYSSMIIKFLKVNQVLEIKCSVKSVLQPDWHEEN